MPYTDSATGMLPFSGRTPRQRHNSYAAAMGQRSTRGVKKRAMLEYFRQHGRCTDQGLAEGLGIPINSICSLRNALCSEGLLQHVDTAVGKYGFKVSVYRLTAVEQERTA